MIDGSRSCIMLGYHTVSNIKDRTVDDPSLVQLHPKQGVISHTQSGLVAADKENWKS